ncbi:MAG: endolytic transglycosylase MltG [Muribaculaceae bacterium]|nr:endolytic transglycosylase MltG [Muribaculaceae bacterium]
MNAKRILTWTAVTLLLLGGAAFGVWRIFLSDTYDGPVTRVYVPAGATEDAVADSLQSSLGGFGRTVARLWRLQSGDASVAHGSYAVDSGMTALEVSRAISRGRQTPLRVTFNNIRTFGDLARRLSQRLEADSAAFMAAADSVLRPAGFDTAGYAAAVLPDTYEYYWTASPETVLSGLLAERNSFWDSTRIAKAEALGLSPVGVATIASIVEEETAKADERPVVARLYLNRLDRNMPLQADPTVKFALGDFGLRRITIAHLGIDSPYNTYRVNGLPPGPIRIVERSSIDAVLDAPEHNYIYMCARPDFSGYHVFETNYNRHTINAARYRRALDARGI